ncbi:MULTISPECIES: hypothetical protein [unclassified Micromonospora]|uniref:hypothetical protein n=1 Tax=unclassified Micromonospora TaxID=2617518 RepID=UPI001C2385BA|nr:MULTISPECIES: hypothetical protein [unclassified Micromonospora]MBU8857323.1 hypothetical protein [Micromonospora sp. WMMB482]MDM4782946.1 hypothetical protein [Micromonospora sp. b486]
MDKVQHQVRDLIREWHGRGHGAFKHFWDEVKSQYDVTYKKLLDEIREGGRVSWDLLAHSVRICVPADEAVTRLETYAGLWQTHRGEAPPGYCGRIVVGDLVVREALASAADAGDDRTRIALLQRERDAAQHALTDHHRQISELEQQVDRLTEEMRRQTHDAETDRRGLIHSLDVLTRRMQQDVARQEEESAQLSARLDRLARENEALLTRQERLAEERDAAEARAGQLLRERNNAEDRAEQLALNRDDAERRARVSFAELAELRESAAKERQRLNQVIGDFESRVAALHRDLDRARSGNGHSDWTGDDRLSPLSGHRSTPWVLDQELPPPDHRRSQVRPGDEDGLVQAPYPG